jgi:AcrR family transcriptional regulator
VRAVAGKKKVTKKATVAKTSRTAKTRAALHERRLPDDRDEADTRSSSQVEGETERTRRTSGERVGGRSERVLRAVLDTTITELARVGYVALRVEDVASAAGVAKTTIYRRFVTKRDLVEAAFRRVGGFHEPPPQTGNVREDLFVLARRALRFRRTPEGAAISRLLSTETDDDLERLRASLGEARREERVWVLQAAVDRGELPLATEVNLLAEMIFLPLQMKRLPVGRELPMLRTMIDIVVTGAQGILGSSRRSVVATADADE